MKADETAAKVEAKIVSDVTKWIGVVLTVLAMLGAGFAFVYSIKGTADAAAQSATNAHARISELKNDVREIKSDVKDLTRVILERLPDK